MYSINFVMNHMFLLDDPQMRTRSLWLSNSSTVFSKSSLQNSLREGVDVLNFEKGHYLRLKCRPDLSNLKIFHTTHLMGLDPYSLYLLHTLRMSRRKNKFLCMLFTFMRMMKYIIENSLKTKSWTGINRWFC